MKKLFGALGFTMLFFFPKDETRSILTYLLIWLPLAALLLAKAGAFKSDKKNIEAMNYESLYDRVGQVFDPANNPFFRQAATTPFNKMIASLGLNTGPIDVPAEDVVDITNAEVEQKVFAISDDVYGHFANKIIEALNEGEVYDGYIKLNDDTLWYDLPDLVLELTYSACASYRYDKGDWWTPGVGDEVYDHELLEANLIATNEASEQVKTDFDVNELKKYI